MNSTNSMGDSHLSGDSNSAGSVSRSGRVRKKNSLLAVYDSPDISEKTTRKRGDKTHKSIKSANNDGIRSHGKNQFISGSRQGEYKYDGAASHMYHHNTSFSKSSFDLVHGPYDGEVPDIAGEEIIDEGMMEDGNGSGDLRNKLYSAGHVRLKSQAESTYMQEKSFMKQRKVIGHNSTGTKIKATRKDKGSPRVTAYMLWAKEQRAIFAKKFPHMDFSSLSKKLSDLWATVPQNQKRMWKTKAAKIMRKKANGAENIKNSAGPSSVSFRKSLQLIPQRKGMKNTTPEVFVAKRPPGRPPKKLIMSSTPLHPQTSSKLPTSKYQPASQYRIPQKVQTKLIPLNAMAPSTSVSQVPPAAEDIRLIQRRTKRKELIPWRVVLKS